MKKTILSIFIIIGTLKSTFALQNQTIAVLPTSTNDTRNCMIIETELANSRKVNIKYFIIESLEKDFDPMAFMYNQKISGLVIISNNEVFLFSTKGLIKSIRINNIEEISFEILNAFPPKEQEKIIKEIVEIDYISPLEEKNPKHSIRLSLGYSISQIEYIFLTNLPQQTINFSHRNLPRYTFSIGYEIDTRYFSGSVGLIYCTDFDHGDFGSFLSGGISFFRGFLLLGTEIILQKTTFNPSKATTEYNNSIKLGDLLPNITNISFIELYTLPIIKFKFSKNDSLSLSPLILFSINLPVDGVEFRDDLVIPNRGTPPPRFIGINISFDIGISENVISGINMKFLLNSINREGYIDTSLLFTKMGLGQTLINLKYKL
ncbi:MAG: hypothetical protein N2712_06680 [Brevinematales bacterium]|nr:hypothetical protein [Brevinematales bacterium]